MIYANITIKVPDPHTQSTPHIWRAVSAAALAVSAIAEAQHDTVTGLPLPTTQKGITTEGEEWSVEVRAAPF